MKIGSDVFMIPCICSCGACVFLLDFFVPVMRNLWHGIVPHSHFENEGFKFQ